MRGTRCRLPPRFDLDGIIPAHAGNTPWRTASAGSWGDHPRTCGEHAMMTRALVVFPGSSPHMRGTLGAFVNTLIGNRDHPRTCGEHVASLAALPSVMGSSPHMRGTPEPGRRERGTERIIPAHAGNTRRGRGCCLLWGDHPRTCGEH